MSMVAEKPYTNYIQYVPGKRNMLRISRVHTWLYRSTNGKIGSRLDGLNILLLETIGRLSQKPRITPMPYFVFDTSFIMVASNGNLHSNPAWLFNLESTPCATVQIGANKFSVEASKVEAAEREGIWRQIVTKQPRYVEYQNKTRRLIPLVRLRRIDQEAP